MHDGSAVVRNARQGSCRQFFYAMGRPQCVIYAAAAAANFASAAQAGGSLRWRSAQTRLPLIAKNTALLLILSDGIHRRHRASARTDGMESAMPSVALTHPGKRARGIARKITSPCDPPHSFKWIGDPFAAYDASFPRFANDITRRRRAMAENDVSNRR